MAPIGTYYLGATPEGPLSPTSFTGRGGSANSNRMSEPCTTSGTAHPAAFSTPTTVATHPYRQCQSGSSTSSQPEQSTIAQQFLPQPSTGNTTRRNAAQPLTHIRYRNRRVNRTPTSLAPPLPGRRGRRLAYDSRAKDRREP